VLHSHTLRKNFVKRLASNFHLIAKSSFAMSTQPKEGSSKLLNSNRLKRMMPKFLLKAPAANKKSVDPERLGADSPALNLTATFATIRTPDTEMTATRKILFHPGPFFT
jgi:hypothetical protein